MRLDVVLIHYHTPELAASALEALRGDLAGGGHRVDWVIVDNGSDAAGRQRLAALGARLIEPGENLGYAGGVNRGLAETAGEAALVLNPDVMVRPGCTSALLALAKRRAAPTRRAPACRRLMAWRSFACAPRWIRPSRARAWSSRRTFRPIRR
jgi:GT2 family glycosyltransferase